MSVTQILSLPWHIYNIFFSSQNDDLQLSDHSGFILLLLAYSTNPAGSNPYVENLARLKDSEYEDSPNSFSFDLLFTRIVHGLRQESPWAPLVTLFHNVELVLIVSSKYYHTIVMFFSSISSFCK